NSPSSPYEGNLYSAWTDFGGPYNEEIVISRSTDDGLSWSPRQEISSAVNAGSHNQGVNISSGPNGEVYVTWAIYDSFPADETAIGFTVSTDGGQTFAPAQRIITNIRGIRNTGTSKNHRVASFPVMAVDLSGGPRQGYIYIVWTNVGEPGINTGPDIDNYMIRSTDGGNTWSPPIRINQDPTGQGKEHYFPWISCDPVTGNLSVISYDDRNVSSTQCEVFVANSTDGGMTWEDFKISDVAFTPKPIPGLAGGYFGDYLGISARGGRVYPVWTDNRTGRALAYVSPFVFQPGQVTVDQKLSDGTSVDSIGRWEGGPDFVPYAVPHTFSFEIGSTETLRGAQKIISNEKYHNWSLDDMITNHREFQITAGFPGQLVSEFNPTKPGITV
ncbi:MAG: hypothetical protein GWN14_01780, partial [candidate division Zixibacteria bacterium]|nr:hypothetical protein [Gammaproteobacteria bacterium]NIX54690.1 hypothetical protein [candidate division Zixibacteria bacterium]